MSAEHHSAGTGGAKSEAVGTALAINYSVPVLFSQVVEDGAPASVKELIAAEMRRMDEEMTKFSTNLLRLYGQNTVQAGMTSTRQENPPATWDIITKSPLVEEEGENRVLKLQFDVSNYRPEEVKVKIVNNMLVVSAQKQESTEDAMVQSEYRRDFLLPLRTKPETVQSSLSTNGILTVRAPLVITPENDEQPQTQAPPQPAGRNSNASNA